jgi:hypothetical protein
MAGFIQRTRNGASLSSMLPPSSALETVAADTRKPNPGRQRLMEQLQASAKEAGNEIEVVVHGGIFIGCPVEAKGKGKGR